MPKKRMHHRKGHRRVGALNLNPGSPLIRGLSVAAGYLLADSINQGIDNVFPKPAAGTSADDIAKKIATNDTIAMVGEVGLGALLLLRKKKSLITTLGGGLLAGAGLKRALKKAKIVSGYQSVPVIGRRGGRVRGYQSVPVVGGIPPMLSGIPPMLSGYTPAGSGVGGYTPAGSGVGYMGMMSDNRSYSNGSGCMG